MGVLVVGVGNVLRGDDGFGVFVARRLLAEPVPEGVRILELGIGGILLVQELLDPVDGLVVIDAIDLERPPGTVFVIRPEVPDVGSMSLWERRDELADMHYATPERAFMLARALGALPSAAWVVGCQPRDVERWGEGLSPEVAASIDAAVREVRAVVTSIGVPWR